MRVEFLPAYSPDLNPIEEAFSCMKAHFRHHYSHFSYTDSTRTDPADALCTMNMSLDVAYSITPSHARGFFSHSQYVASYPQ